MKIPFPRRFLTAAVLLAVGVLTAPDTATAKDKGKGPKIKHHPQSRQVVKKAVKLDAKDWSRGASDYAPGRSGNLPPGHGGIPPGQLKKYDREIGVQSALARLGYYSGPFDGSIGPMSRAAISRYQAERGLLVTGIIDDILLRSLGLY